MDLEKGELNIKTVIALVVFLGTLTVAFYSQVIIPIRDIQTRLANIEVALIEQKNTFTKVAEEHKSFEERITKLETLNNIK